MKRYFIVFYSASNEKRSGKGNITVTTTGGRFVNRLRLTKKIESFSVGAFRHSDIVITNILELKDKQELTLWNEQA